MVDGNESFCQLNLFFIDLFLLSVHLLENKSRSWLLACTNYELILHLLVHWLEEVFKFRHMEPIDHRLSHLSSTLASFFFSSPSRASSIFVCFSISTSKVRSRARETISKLLKVLFNNPFSRIVRHLNRGTQRFIIIFYFALYGGPVLDQRTVVRYRTISSTRDALQSPPHAISIIILVGVSWFGGSWCARVWEGVERARYGAP